MTVKSVIAKPESKFLLSIGAKIICGLSTELATGGIWKMHINMQNLIFCDRMIGDHVEVTLMGKEH